MKKTQQTDKTQETAHKTKKQLKEEAKKKEKETLAALRHGHRERTRQRIIQTDIDSIEETEILEALLMYAIPRKDVKLLAKLLLEKFQTLGNIICADAQQLCQFKDVKDSTLALFKLIRAGNNAILRRDLISQPIFATRGKMMDYCFSILGRERKESFHILFLDAKLHLLLDKKMGDGTINKVSLYPREIIHKALELGATSMVLIHNHPSGDARPSEQDILITQQLRDVGKTLSLELSDHIIISRTGAVSMMQEGHLK